MLFIKVRPRVEFIEVRPRFLYGGPGRMTTEPSGGLSKAAISRQLVLVYLTHRCTGSVRGDDRERTLWRGCTLRRVARHHALAVPAAPAASRGSGLERAGHPMESIKQLQ